MSLLRNREFFALAGTAFARSQAYSTILLALALYTAQYHASGTVQGLFGTAFAFVQLLVVLPLGRKIDTGNAKRYLLAGLLLNVVVFVAFIFVQSAAQVIVVRSVQGLAASMLWITGSTVVGEISPDDSSGRWLGSYNQVAAFSSFAGDLIGGYLLYVYDFTTTYLVLSGVTLVAFVLVYYYLRDNPGGKKDADESTGLETFRALLDRPMIRSLVFFRLAFSFGKMSVIIFLPILAYNQFHIGTFFVGWIMAGGKLTKTVLQGYMGDLTDRIGRKPYFVAAGALLYGLGTALIPVSFFAEGVFHPFHVVLYGKAVDLGGAFLVLFIAYGILGIADSLRLPASMALFIEEGERFDSAASSMSLRSISWKIGQVVGPFAIGLTKDYVSTTAAFLVAAAFIVLATGVFVITYRRSTKADVAVPSSGD